MSKQYRQGDVLLVEVEALPDGEATQLERDAAGRPVLAHGEVTGHAHVVEAEVRDIAIEWISVGRERYLRSAAPFAVKHEEHSAIVAAPGTFKVIQQQRYTPEELSPAYD